MKSRHLGLVLVLFGFAACVLSGTASAQINDTEGELQSRAKAFPIASHWQHFQAVYTTFGTTVVTGHAVATSTQTHDLQ
jgi:hypothetical protein